MHLLIFLYVYHFIVIIILENKSTTTTTTRLRKLFYLDAKGKGEGAVFGVPINQCIDPARKRSTVETPTDPEVSKKQWFIHNTCHSRKGDSQKINHFVYYQSFKPTKFKLISSENILDDFKHRIFVGNISSIPID